jgi:hypothetical protein
MNEKRIAGIADQVARSRQAALGEVRRRVNVATGGNTLVFDIDYVYPLPGSFPEGWRLEEFIKRVRGNSTKAMRLGLREVKKDLRDAFPDMTFDIHGYTYISAEGSGKLGISVNLWATMSGDVEFEDLGKLKGWRR